MQNLIILALLLTTAAFAKPNTTFAFLVTSTAIDYSEYSQKNDILDTENSSFGDIGGFCLYYGYNFNATQTGHINIAFTYRQQQGKTTYVGSLLGKDNPYGSYQGESDNLFVDYKLQISYLYHYKSNLRPKLLFALAKHLWERKLLPNQTETYTWLPLVFGFGLDGEFFHTLPLSIQTSFAYCYGINPTMQLSTTQTNFTLGRAENFVFDLNAIYHLPHHIDAIVGYNYNYQIIQPSNTLNTSLGKMYEPFSKDYQQRVQVGLGYSF